jgi:hypothetical protein
MVVKIEKIGKLPVWTEEDGYGKNTLESRLVLTHPLAQTSWSRYFPVSSDAIFIFLGMPVSLSPARPLTKGKRHIDGLAAT